MEWRTKEIQAAQNRAGRPVSLTRHNTVLLTRRKWGVGLVNASLQKQSAAVMAAADEFRSRCLL
jgi:hypothetical protein